MNLLIDIGNTRTKYALAEAGAVPRLVDEQELEGLSFSKGIICTVKNELPSQVEEMKKKGALLLFTAETKVPLKNLYKSAATLGSDRLAAAVAAKAQFPSHPVLAIDAGTCVKYNFVNEKGEYLGGAISPGLQMRFKALNAYTDRLPLLEKDEAFNELTGTDTKSSLLSGVQNGIVAEADGIIDRYRQLYPGIKVILTGGDASFFEKRLKNSIFADSFLVLKGLNIILGYNAK